ncbi:MAG: hypothetical protein F6K41_07770 [Symploca sp. SIO3E6]|nr:hypothetical protein [Caldora sp. SIO3E6]
MWTTKSEYTDPGIDYYEKKYHASILKNLQHKAHAMGLELVPLNPDMPQTPSSPTLAT